MAVIATNALERRDSTLGEQRQLLVNLELNNSCVHTRVCGNTCYLNLIAPNTEKKSLSPAMVLAAAREIIRDGWDVRHLVLPGKEVWETSSLLLQIIEDFHAASPHSRPGSIGIITASASGLKRHAARLTETPLSFVSISLDTQESGLRSPRNNRPLLEAAVQLKEADGVELLGVNTVLSAGNLQSAIQIGKDIESTGVNQWTLSPLLLPRNGRMEAVLSATQIREMIDRVSQEFAGSDLDIIFDMDVPLLRAVVDDTSLFAHGAGRWRFEHQLSGAPNILLEAGNPGPGHFFRMDWAGQLMSKEDYRWIGRSGCYGEYEPGRLLGLLKELREQRGVTACVA